MKNVCYLVSSIAFLFTNYTDIKMNTPTLFIYFNHSNLKEKQISSISNFLFASLYHNSH